MPNTVPDAETRNEMEELKRELQQLAGVVAKRAARPGISDHALALISAFDYQDEALAASSLTSLATALAELARDMIPRELDATEGVKAGLKEGWRIHIEGKAFEIDALDTIRDKVETLIDERIAAMSKVRKLVKSLEDLDHQVENAQAIKDGIRDLRTFREEFLKGWPSSRKPPSPVDKAAIARAREAIARGGKGMGKGELVWGSERPIPD